MIVTVWLFFTQILPSVVNSVSSSERVTLEEKRSIHDELVEMKKAKSKEEVLDTLYRRSKEELSAMVLDQDDVIDDMQEQLDRENDKNKKLKSEMEDLKTQHSYEYVPKELERVDSYEPRKEGEGNVFY
ncbi:uncharacterized protein [Ptychodera flava]|uniref:uncharacterized protein n=1 Tax=Ptychodera flava TaxID=63121 RepID=UPI00396A4E45